MQAIAIVEGFRLSPQQRRLWMLQQSNIQAFSSHLALLLEGELRTDALRQALHSITARHESLRSTFRRLSGVLMPVQSVADELAPSWQIVDHDPATIESRREFNFEHGPILHATLFRFSKERRLLFLSLPALCADRRTLNNLFLELGQSYAMAVGGSELNSEPFQYIQFSEWQNTLSEEAEAAEGKEYWNKHDLSNASAVLLPGQKRVGRDAHGEFQSVKVKLTPEQTAQVAAAAEQYETTSATILLAAWQTLLSRFTQQSVVVGNVSEGRPYELLHDAFGLFARALPVCCQFTKDLRFHEVLAQIDSFQRETSEWQDYFELQQADGAPEYFTFGYEYAELPLPRVEAGLQISVHSLHCCTEPFRLKLSGIMTGSALELEFQYDSASFVEDDVRRLAGQFQTILNSVLSTPEAFVEELEIVTEAERRQVLFDWNQTRRDYAQEHCLHQLFEQQVERTPDATAVVFRDRQLTFAELNQRANQLARYLQGQGVGPEVPVGLCVERSLEMLVAVLGILKAGGAYVPLDPRNPHERINLVLKDAGVSVLLTQEHLSTGQFEAQSILLDADWEKTIAVESAENVQSEASPDNLAYVIYTSGSTGQPKGVMVQHRSAANLAAALHDEIYSGQGSALKVGLNAPLAFDASVKQLLTLLYGHSIYVLSEELRLDVEQLLSYLDQQALDALDCTPSQLKLLLAAGFDSQSRRVPKIMLIGGEALDESSWSMLGENQRTRFHNVYGPTECTVDATWIAVQDAPERPTIGRPIPNAQVYILDNKLQPVGIHLTGELYVGGAGVARGYLNRPEMTAEKFVPDPLSVAEGARLYRTGDLARYLPDGSIEFLGRDDSQVKVRGHRIELGEIESVLRQHENVRQAVVIAREDANAGVQLVAYVVGESESVGGRELRQMASERLPDYMVPSFVVTLDELPLTRNGKVDLKALPAPEAVQLRSTENYVAPRNQIEETITCIWQEVLQVERVGVNDNFFDAGGHSLLMVRVHNKLREALGKEVSIVEMFAKPTISALAESLRNGNGHKPTFQKVMARAESRKQAANRRRKP